MLIATIPHLRRFHLLKILDFLGEGLWCIVYLLLLVLRILKVLRRGRIVLNAFVVARVWRTRRLISLLGNFGLPYDLFNGSRSWMEKGSYSP